MYAGDSKLFYTPVNDIEWIYDIWWLYEYHITQIGRYSSHFRMLGVYACWITDPEPALISEYWNSKQAFFKYLKPGHWTHSQGLYTFNKVIFKNFPRIFQAENEFKYIFGQVEIEYREQFAITETIHQTFWN